MNSLASYTVIYRGGLPGLPKSKAAGIKFDVHKDHFELTGKMGSKKFWTDLTIPFSMVHDVTIAGRQVSTFEAVVGGMESRQLDRSNNIHISFTNEAILSLLLRLEMLSGVTVPVQAKRCAEFEDLLRVNNIYTHFSPR